MIDMRTYLAWVLVILLCTAPGAFGAADIIIDNPNAALVGSWTTGTVTTTRYGADYYYCPQNPSGTNSATYLPSIPCGSGDWAVYTWYPAGTNRPTQAQFVVHTASGDNTVYINQQVNGRQWFHIGTYAMQSGLGNSVRITNVGSETTKYVMADAVRFYSPTASADPDTTPPGISAVTATPAPTSAVISWTTDEPATSQVEYGTSASYGTQSIAYASLVLNHSVTITGLSLPAAYHFRVKSDDLYGNAAVSGDSTFATSSEIPQTPSFRAAWATGWDDGFRSAAEVTTMIDTLHQANYNVVIPEVRKNGDAFYDSAYESRATEITDPLPFDPLADMIAKGHAVGMEVHAWLVAYRIANSTATNAPPVFHEHPEWLTKDNTGELLNNNFYLLDQGVPGVQDYICKIVLDIVSKYEVDGINWDYIRYQGATWGYNEITRQRFFDEYGFWPPISSSEAGWDIWCDYRRQQVTDLVKKCYLEVMAIKPRVKMTADTQSYGSIDAGFSGTGPYTSVLQDWPKWMEAHILDASIPMDYRDDSVAADAKSFRDWAQFTTDNRYGRHAYIGMSPYRNTITNSIGQIYAAIGEGADGISTFSYTATNNAALPDSEFYNAIGENIYTAPVPVPDMPWKSAPTTGIIFGTVTDASHPTDPVYSDWIYKAAVSVSGPVTQNTVTDATGTYGFLDLPPGTYSITVTKSGFAPQTISGVVLTTGQVDRRDVELGLPVTVTSPAGVVVNGWSLLSLPVQPADPDPAVVFNGIDIDGRLYRWDNPTQSLFIYDSWGPEQFGEMNLENGYWLDSFSPGTISYQGIPSSATTHDISLPTAGWAIIGCPFPVEKQWPSTTVRHGADTASILDASHTNGWLNSSGYWWDASTQSLVDFGLPEDFASWETLQPWHGYWVQTYVSGLTLTIR